MATDKLSCQIFVKIDLAKIKAKSNINQFILTKLNCLSISFISIDKPVFILRKNYIKFWKKITIYFITLWKPANITIKKLNMFTKRIFKFEI